MGRVLFLLALALGAASRFEETTSGFSVGLSSNAAWLALAFFAARGRRWWVAAALGAVLETLANAGYYAWVLLLEPGTPLAAAAGSPLRWLLLGASGGAAFGAAGALAMRERGLTPFTHRRCGSAQIAQEVRRSARSSTGSDPAQELHRLAAALPLSGAVLVEALDGFRATDAPALLLALGLPAALPGVRRELRGLGAGAAALIGAVAATGVLTPLSP